MDYESEDPQVRRRRGKREENRRGRNGENIIITFAVARHEQKDIQF
jgi:hypothetical protein